MSDLDTTHDNDEIGTPIPGEEAPASAPIAADTTADDGGTSDEIESRAKTQGWVPKDQFRGPADKWVDAAEFVRRGEEELPILRERNKAMERRLTDLEKRDRERSESFTQLERMNEIALKRQRDQLIGSYEHAIRAAVEVGDVQRYDQLRRDQAERLYTFDSEVRAQPKPDPQPQRDTSGDAIVQDWYAKNPWASTDPALNLAAQYHHVRLQREKPNLSLADNLEETRKAVMEQHPDRFGIVRRAPAVEPGGSRRPANSAAGNGGVARLPADARAQGERFVREGLYKNLAEYAEVYHNQ